MEAGRLGRARIIRRNSHRRSRLQLAASLFALVALLTMTVAQVIDIAPAAAQGAASSLGMNLPVDQPTQVVDLPTEPPPTDVPPPTEEQPTVSQPTVQATIEPTSTMAPSATVTNELLGSINIAYWVCPDGVDPSATSYGDLQANCTDSANGIQFALSNGGQPFATQATGYYADGAIGFGEVPTGQVTISQVPAPSSAAVICHGIVSHGGSETGDMLLQVTNGSVTWNLKDDEIAYCDWYNGSMTATSTTPTATTSTATSPTPSGSPANELIGSFNLDYWECPSGFDVTTANAADLSTNCTGQRNGVQFNIAATGGMTASQLTGADSDSAVDFSQIPTGQTTISQIPVPVAAAVICHGIVSHGGPETGDIQMTVTNGTITWNLKDDEIVFCNWYVNPAGAGASTPESGYGKVYINKHACPATFDAYNADIYQVAANCHDNAGAVTFTLNYSDGIQQRPATTSNSGINDVTWTFVPVGKISIWEDNPAGYGSPVVFCKVDLEDGTDVVPFAEIPTIDGRAIAWNLHQNQVLWCDWFNVPAGTGTVHILKHACPAGYDVATKTIYNFAAECHDDAGAVEFKVNASGTVYTGTTSGTGINDVNFPNLPAGTVSIAETLPSGYGTPVAFCKVDLEDGTDVVPFAQIPLSGTAAIGWQLGVGHVLWCDWYNVPPPPTVSVTIYKFDCGGSPSDYQTGGVPDYQKFNTRCTNAMPGVNFTATNAGGTVANGTTTNSNPMTLANIPIGVVSIAETLPGGYAAPYVFCGPDFANGAQTVTNATISLTVAGPSGVICSWYNLRQTNGSITIYKWTCPAGYDYAKPGADPKTECPEATNGVNFTLVDTDPATVDLQTMTGDSIPGAVYFGGEKPGDYTVTETVPAGIANVFVLDCSGGMTGMVHPAPLATGNVLGISLGSGDQIVCNWYNVPAQEPNMGDLTIHIYICTTSTFVSDVQCETYEQGKQFIVQPGGLPGTTSNYGVLAFQGLAAGNYTITEVNDQPCKVISAQRDQNNNPVDALNPDGSVKVTVARETVVGVYNCTATPTGSGKLPNSGKLPTKFPNTGMQDTQVIEPDTGTPPAETPSVEPCAATGTPTVATPDTGVSCGAVPVSIEIPAIEIDAKIEVLETVNGEMQQPTGPNDVAWYKETPKLGAPGNIVMAGHLNYWGVPEGVFFNLATLQPGDRISITGADGEVGVYQVTWVRQADATKPPAADVLAETATPSLTLITCGGPWNAETSLYTERTVVRAVLVDPGT